MQGDVTRCDRAMNSELSRTSSGSRQVDSWSFDTSLDFPFLTNIEMHFTLNFLSLYSTYSARLEWVWGGVSPPAVLDDAAEPSLYPGQVVHVVHVGLRQRNVPHEVLEARLLLVDGLDLAAVVVHVALVRRDPDNEKWRLTSETETYFSMGGRAGGGDMDLSLSLWELLMSASV